MPVGISFFLALFGALGLFATFYFVVLGIIEAKRAKAQPHLGISHSGRVGSLAVWVRWDETAFDVQFYRIRMTHSSPEGTIKEGMFTVTMDPAHKTSFTQEIELPEEFKRLLTSNQIAERSVISIEVKSTDESTLAKHLSLNQARAIYLGQRAATKNLPPLANTLPPDAPAVMSLSFGELVERKRRLKELTDAAKAKAAKAAAAPPKPAAPPAVAPSAPAKPAATTPGSEVAAAGGVTPPVKG